MNIPQSAIEPFGVIGIPLIGTTDALITHLDELFKFVTEDTALYDVENDANLFAQLAGMKIIHMGATESTITISDRIKNGKGNLLAATITIYYVLPNNIRRKKVYTLNPFGLLY